ncbi:putative alpha/beta hydrolase family protein [Xylariales sp. AK1849]|nr:putative alpha/beta hydrolase family protein [Xylariales sp. AK1849]
MALLSRLFDVPAESRPVAVVATTVVTTVALLSLARWSLYPRRTQVIAGPMTTTIPKLSKDELAKAPYQPDHFPGGRDVVTPYGNIHVYEFGPEDGRKVLLLHGISTSCMTLTAIANDLAGKGCRVMCYDLFGRGYTDGVGDLPFDTRLFVSQILLVLASSHLSWTGDDAFSIIGYSLGGGIAVNFAATFPHLVKSLVLLAPGGLVRAENIGRASRMVFTSGIIPTRILEALTKRRLRTPLRGAVSKKRRQSIADELVSPLDQHKEGFVDAAVHEAVDTHANGEPAAADDDDTPAPISPLEARIAAFIHWMLDAHQGFVPAFISTIHHAPLLSSPEQRRYWRELAKRKPGTTAVILARNDELVQKADYALDALPLIGGQDNVFWRVVPGGHNFPFTHSTDALSAIYEFWEMK